MEAQFDQESQSLYAYIRRASLNAYSCSCVLFLTSVQKLLLLLSSDSFFKTLKIKACEMLILSLFRIIEWL